MICPKCGTVNNDSAVFCITCGNNLRTSAPAQNVSYAPAPQPVSAPAPTSYAPAPSVGAPSKVNLLQKAAHSPVFIIGAVMFVIMAILNLIVNIRDFVNNIGNFTDYISNTENIPAEYIVRSVWLLATYVLFIVALLLISAGLIMIIAGSFNRTQMKTGGFSMAKTGSVFYLLYVISTFGMMIYQLVELFSEYKDQLAQAERMSSYGFNMEVDFPTRGLVYSIIYILIYIFLLIAFSMAITAAGNFKRRALSEDNTPVSTALGIALIIATVLEAGFAIYMCYPFSGLGVFAILSLVAEILFFISAVLFAVGLFVFKSKSASAPAYAAAPANSFASNTYANQPVYAPVSAPASAPVSEPTNKNPYSATAYTPSNVPDYNNAYPQSNTNTADAPQTVGGVRSTMPSPSPESNDSPDDSGFGPGGWSTGGEL